MRTTGAVVVIASSCPIFGRSDPDRGPHSHYRSSEDDEQRRAPRIHLGPDSAPDWLAEAVVAGGAELVPLDEAEAIVWGDARNVDALAAALDDADHIRWVQLPFAGIENFVDHLDHDRVWTCGKGVYAEPVAEMALALGVAGLRNVGAYARASEWSRPGRAQPARTAT